MGALERLEHALEVLVMNADAGVLDLETGDLIPVEHAHGHAAVIGKLDRIGQEIDQDLAQPVLVGINRRRKPGRWLEGEFDAFGAGLQAEHVDELIEEFTQTHLVAVEVETSGFDLGNIEQAVDEARQILRVAADHPDRVDPARRDRRIAFEDLRIADHRIERRAQLVTEPDHVAALGFAGRFREFLGLLQLGVGTLVRLDLLHQQFGLTLGLLLGNAAALVHQHEDPGRDRGDDRQDEEHRPQRRLQDVLLHVQFERDLEIDEGENGADDRGKQQQHADILADVGVHRIDDAARQGALGPAADLA